MPRKARIVAPGLPHHVTQRGNRRCQVFFDDRDDQHYIMWMTRHGQAALVRLWAYCLMPNHVHLILVPSDHEGLARMLRPLHSQYAQYINSIHSWEGHLWEQRYYSTVLDWDHLSSAVRYVERNPARAGFVARPVEYAWSSAAPHCARRRDPALSPDLPLLGTVSDWAEWLAVEQDEELLADLRVRTARGIPYGDTRFIQRFS
jgi:putative transposase